MAHNLKPKLILSGGHGRYLPQAFCERIDEEEAASLNLDFRDVLVCQEGPCRDWYWERWSDILDDYKRTDEHCTWHLVHDGDLFEVPEGYKWREY